MKTMQRAIQLMLVLVFAATVLSCNKWLDVKPKDQVKDVELFETETGFKEALSGVYATLAGESLYGKQLTYGMLGIVAVEWESAAAEYDADKRYDYTGATATVKRIDSIWARMYFAISNTNKILQEIDARQVVFTGDNYKIIKGEALALRAFMHFDLLRLFGASFEENPAKIAIPYNTASSDKVFPQLTVTAFTDSVIADLSAAEALLKPVDPIRSGRTVTTDDDNGYLLNRKVHLNYYAVRGLLARAYLHRKDYDKALACANEVIGSGSFPWNKQANIISDTADLTLSTEQLFGLNVVNMDQIAKKYFSPNLGGSAVFSMTRQRYQYDLFESNTADYRYLYQFKEEGTGSIYIKKYDQLTSTAWPSAYKNKLPLIRLSEMYFIAAECLLRTDITAAAGMLNAIRTHRGIVAVNVDAANFETVETAEYRREFTGEGQLFFYYKRKNKALIPNGTENMVQLKAYKFPMPQAEYENASRVNNR